MKQNSSHYLIFESIMKQWKQVLFFLFIGIIFFNSCKQKPKPLPYANTVLFYLENLSLRSDSMLQQIWKMPISFLGIDPEAKELYFIYPRYGYTRAQVLQKMCIDTSDVFFANCNGGDCEFGSMKGNVDSIVPFKTPISNLKFDTNTVFNFGYKNFSYKVNLKTLHALQDSNKYYHTPNVMLLDGVLDESKHCVNIGSYISKKGDTLLTSLAKKLTLNCKTKEQQAQALLNFVSSEITYSYADYWYQSEVVRNAHEVLLTGLADCSGKSTLYASLLEQLEIPYCLLYYPRHMNVGIAGNFADVNGYNNMIDGVTYYQAETTVADFKIGTSKLEDGNLLAQNILYAVPQKSAKVFITENKKPIMLKWLRDLDPAFQ